jgi:PAS domain S-box-containing protein
VASSEAIGKSCLPVICEATGAAKAGLWVLGSDNRAFELVGSVGVPSEKLHLIHHVPVDSSVVLREALRSREPIIVASRSEVERRYGHLSARFTTEPAGTWVVIPLVVQDRDLGCLSIELSSWMPVPLDDREFLLAAAGQCAQALERARLHEAERLARTRAQTAEQRRAFLAEASAELAKSLDHEVTLRKIAELAVPRLADWCGVELAKGSDGQPTRVALVHVDPTKIELANELRRRYPPDPTAPRGVPNVLRTGRSELYREISDDLLVKSARDPEHLRIMRDIGMKSAMSVPITVGGQTLGVISFVAAESGRLYDDEDVGMAEELGRRAGVAIQNARLFEAERRARTEAEVAEQRRASIQLVSDAALAHLEIDPLLTEMLARVRRVFRCDTATILMLSADGKRLEVRASDGIEREVWDRVGVPSASGVAGVVVAQARPVIVNETATAEIVSPILKERVRSMMAAPLAVERGIVGVIHVGCRQHREFVDSDLELLQTVAGRVAVAIDRANAHEALRLAQEKLEVALSAGRMGVWEWSIPTARVKWSPALERIHGLEPGTFPGTFEAYQHDIHPEDKEELLRTVQETMAAGRDHYVEYRIVLPDGQVRWVAGHGNVVSRVDGKPDLMMGVCFDITERRQLEQARESALAELQQTLRDNEIFAAVLAHDLRNPLGAMMTAAQLVMLRHEGDASIVPPLRRVLSSGDRMTRMIDQLLDFTRARMGGGFDLTVREADFAKICEQAIGELQLAHPDWRMTVESLGEFAGAWDADRLLQVVSNLVANAGQHGLGGGDILIKLDGTQRDAVVLEVHNEGAIPAAHLAELFAPFRGRREGKGAGLGIGLFITREIARAHGGSIEVRSSDGTTSFTVRLPRRTKVASRPAPHTSPGPMNGARRPILLVEDDVDVREGLVDTLEDLGFEVVTAVNGLVALNMLVEKKVAPSVILLDLMMPVMDGYRFLEEVRKRDMAGIPIVVVTAGHDIDATRLGKLPLIRKPIKLPQLQSTLDQLYRNGAAE